VPGPAATRPARGNSKGAGSRGGAAVGPWAWTAVGSCSRCRLTVGSGIARTRRISVIRLTPAAAGYCRLVPSTRFVVQLHDATTLHFDLRIQAGEVLRSWAVPKGPSLDPAVRRLAVPVEDHELPAGEFEGVHDGQLRGSGAVIIWDEGLAEITRDEPGHLSFTLNGSKLAGGFALTRTGERRWILVKTRDATARPGSDIVAERPASVRTGRTWQDVATEAGPSTRTLRSPQRHRQASARSSVNIGRSSFRRRRHPHRGR
jgi:DNA ligase D-like protein (predicted 3'-phosphoesterase)